MRKDKQENQLGLCRGFPNACSQLEPHELGLTFMRAVQWPIPGILKAPVPVEELDWGVRAGTRSSRSPTPFRNWTANADRGWAKKEGKWQRWMERYCDNSLTISPIHTHTFTHLSVFAFGPLRSSSVESVQLGQDQSQMLPQRVAVSPQFHLLSGPLVLFAADHSLKLKKCSPHHREKQTKAPLCDEEGILLASQICYQILL